MSQTPSTESTKWALAALVGFFGLLLIGVFAELNKNTQTLRDEEQKAVRESEQRLLNNKEFLQSKAGQCWSQHRAEGWSVDVCRSIAEHKVQIGMTAVQARMA